MQTITVYSSIELKELDPDAFSRAYDKWVQDQYGFGLNWQDEIMDSLKAIFEYSDINLRDWEISDSSPSYVKFSMDNEVYELTGQRAIAWLENNLLGQFRYKDGIKHIKERIWKSECITNPARPDGAFIHKVGELKSCPMTGVCFDEDFLESLQKDIRAGDSIGEAYKNLAQVASELFSAEWKQQTSEEEFLIQDHLQYTEDGNLYD